MKFLTGEWIKAGYIDLKAIAYMLEDADMTTVVSFHCEQAIEKFFKALLEEKDITVPKTHDIRRLHKLIDDFDLDANELDLLLKINELYIDSRYPGELGLLPYGKPTLEDAREFYGFAEDVFERVCEVLGIDRSEVIE